ncbi:hypothetical protein [Pontibacter sp. H249]|uniref:hypothetical protein n=1 Tax=Pontibacter sp. H249 TaxID=3133420 RepID=UPI0030C1FD85
MKSTLVKVFGLIILASATVSCQRGSCPAYDKIASQPKYKSTFLSDSAPKGRY